jgi:hypothetical protein
MVALHNREKGNLAPFTSIAQYNLKPRLVLLRIHPTLHSAGLSALNLASVPRPTAARDLDALPLLHLVRHIPVSQSGESRAIEINLCLTVPDYSVLLFYLHITTTHHPLATFGNTSSSRNSC